MGPEVAIAGDASDEHTSSENDCKAACSCDLDAAFTKGTHRKCVRGGLLAAGCLLGPLCLAMV